MQPSSAMRWAALGAALLVHGARAEELPAKTSAASLPVADADEPTLQQAQRAAARQAAGDVSEDASRASRARGAHWAPVVRGQLGGTATDQTRDGTMYQDPLHWTNLGTATTWGVTLTWDLPQAIYSRDESQLALATVHLARTRQAAAERAAELYAERLRRLASCRDENQPTPRARLDAALALLETTAALDALTGGLFRGALDRAQQRADQLFRSLTPSPHPTSFRPETTP